MCRMAIGLGRAQGAGHGLRICWRCPGLYERLDDEAAELVE